MQFSTSELAVWLRRLTVTMEVVGSNPMESDQLFLSNKALYYAILHLYLQQPGIIKMFLLCNIPGKVLLFFLNKQDIMRVNCMQNVTKNYILLRNVACVLNSKNYITRDTSILSFGRFNFFFQNF